jgi:hypothetical protein
MTLLEIKNRAEARPVIEQIHEDVRSLPPMVMLYVLLKGVIGTVFNVFVLFFLTLTGNSLKFSLVLRIIEYLFFRRLGSGRFQ